ncbi:MAG: HEPN domain-containing protein [Candidatus Lokiarchaeota archaeon]|nr:HEPN domain-containing protein [Candidatus Lokiarchaeota archaeon]MBD3200572.1 HEPN domain-containing protein [Candidatus Lokiarchaeota archaeon]
MTREISYKWLEEAENDFEMGEILLKSKKFNGAVFHYQQAAEKSLKAILYYNDKQPWGHSILSLINDLIEEGSHSYEKFITYAREIDRHYTTTRYPDALPNISPKDAYDSIIATRIRKEVEEIINFVKNDIIGKSENG